MTAEWPSTIQNKTESKEAERGSNVEIVIKMMRHGQRTPDGALTDSGRRITREMAQESGLSVENFHAVKAYGSSVGEKKGVGKRAFETAEVYANEIAEDEAYAARVNDLLSYETLKNPMHYNHDAVVKENLPPDFDFLTDEEKIAASKAAQRVAAERGFDLTTPEAKSFSREAAGAYATVLNHYRVMTKRLRSGSRVLLPMGTHGTVLEYFLMYCLVRKDENGHEVTGFNNIDDIGGEFSPSDSYTVRVGTDNEGKEKEIILTLDGTHRPQDEFHIDKEKMDELAREYEKLHKNEIKE